jgi:hypothetical protein
LKPFQEAPKAFYSGKSSLFWHFVGMSLLIFNFLCYPEGSLHFERDLHLSFICSLACLLNAKVAGRGFLCGWTGVTQQICHNRDVFSWSILTGFLIFLSSSGEKVQY